MFLISAVSTHIFGVRNLAASWPAVALCFAWLLGQAPGRLATAATALVLVAFGLAAISMLDGRYQRPDYQSAAAFIDRTARPGDVVIDETGVGRAVGDIFEQAQLAPMRVAITAGAEVTPAGENRWHVSKSILISTVDALLHVGELRFAAALGESETMKAELLDFRRHLGAAGRATYAARTGKHDDLVLAVAIAAWWLRRPDLPTPELGGY